MNTSKFAGELLISTLRRNGNLHRRKVVVVKDRREGLNKGIVRSSKSYDTLNEDKRYSWTKVIIISCIESSLKPNAHTKGGMT